jgi:SulP family sulfate permease
VLLPKLVTTLREGYDRRQAVADVTAGIVVGIVALPLAIAFAIASGVTPERGLWTAVIAGFIISALGGSRVQIGGPTGAFIIIVYGIVQEHGVDGLLVATVLAGALLVLLGVVRLGSTIKFIPRPVITGFTSGIAVVIFSGQLGDFFGLTTGPAPPDFIGKLRVYAAAAGTINPAALMLSLVCLSTIIVWPRVSRRVPGPLVAILVAIALAQIFDLRVETIGMRFGELSTAFPTPALPRVSLADLPDLVRPAFAIALLGAVESLLSAVVADGMIGTRHRSNMELVAQGIANIVTPLFGGIPATGAIARTATNVKNGGRTPIAGIVHALTLLLITVAFGRWASRIPLAALAAILIIVSYHMSEWRSFMGELRAPRSDVLVMLSTFALTVLVDLTVAIEVGMVLAAFLFVRRMAEVTNVSAITRELADRGESESYGRTREMLAVLPPGVEVFEISGPFFFGAAERFRETLGQIAAKPKVLIVRMRDVPSVDSTAIHLLTELVHRSRKQRTLVILADIHSQPLFALQRSGLIDEIGREHALIPFEDAIDVARAYVAARAGGATPADPPTVKR